MYQSCSLQDLLRHPAIRRGGDGSRGDRLPTGFPALDEVLPGGGWPMGLLTELISEKEGIGELQLLMPALARLSREGRWIVSVAPPYVPYPPALSMHGIELSRMLVVCGASSAENLWAAEQSLRSGVCGAVLLWMSVTETRSLRRLQLAADTGNAWGVLFQKQRFTGARAAVPSPVGVRLRLDISPQGLTAEVLKCRGRAPSAPLLVFREQASLLPHPGAQRFS